MCITNQIATDLFLEVNAGLRPDIPGCDSRVKVNNAYCVRPRYDWDHPVVPPTSSSVSMISKTSSTTTKSTTAATPTPTGLKVSTDGTYTNGVTCLSASAAIGNCCSMNGYCGSTTAHCVAGCQPKFGKCTLTNGEVVSGDGKCGTGVTCQSSTFGNCCSASGYCGAVDIERALRNRMLGCAWNLYDGAGG